MTNLAATSAPPSTTRPATHMLTCSLAAARRVVLVTLRNPSLIVMSVVQSVVFLLIFRYVFGGAITPGTLSYVNFMVPGVLTVTVLFAVMGVGTAVAGDVDAGVIDRFRSLPMPSPVALYGRAAGEHLLTTLTLLITTAVAFAIGFRIHNGWGIVGLLGLCMLAAVAFTWVFIAVGLAAGNVQAAQGAGFLVLPLSFVSSAYVPVTSMPGWLQTFAMHQPVTVLVEANRYLTQGDAALAGLGHSGGYYVIAAVAWCVGILAVAQAGALALFRRR
ncbi:ABC transporter permease [Rhodococcus sp. NPDC058521]|uniref:ABC transporter permease n=1 Tax=Rhodococcus sp. NPDC058521 TaxID=3346536 RepID=UPI0036484EAC